MSGLYIALAGNFVNGFKGHAFVDVTAMNSFIQAQITEGVMATSIRLDAPPDASQPGYTHDGKYLVLLGDITSRIRAVGPFATEEDADEYGEDGDMLDENTYAVLQLEESV